jgi:hypothetical protein
MIDRLKEAGRQRRMEIIVEKRTKVRLISRQLSPAQSKILWKRKVVKCGIF